MTPDRRTCPICNETGKYQPRVDWGSIWCPRCHPEFYKRHLMMDMFDITPAQCITGAIRQSREGEKLPTWDENPNTHPHPDDVRGLLGDVWPPRTKTTPIPDVRLVRDEDGSVSSQSGTKKITDEITDTTLEDMGF